MRYYLLNIKNKGVFFMDASQIVAIVGQGVKILAELFSNLFA